MPRLPNFFLVGAPKAGTTSLYNYLGQHPAIYMSPIKEPHFFASEIRAENLDAVLRRDAARDARSLREFLSGPMRGKRFGGIVTEWQDYVRLFAHAGAEAALGEASACYLWSRTAPRSIAEKIPGARILVMLRNPADRAFSQYLHALRHGAVRWSLREHIRRNLGYRPGPLCLHYPFLEFGLYSEQLGRYLGHFGRNVWIGLYDTFHDRPLELFQDICRFLGVDAGFQPDMGRRYLEAQVPRTAAAGWLKRSGLWRAAAAVTPARVRPLLRRALIRKPGATRMDPADRRYLLDFYREDIGKLANLLGRDFDFWLQEER